ncbi:MAG TPA: YibE/F family protein [Candidatus Acidoferrum sp.]|nr:YibE/F family protein [Candidatus Acidoferrum sp.]
METEKTAKKKHRRRKLKPGAALYAVTVALSVIFILVGNHIATKDLGSFKGGLPEEAVVTARVDAITDRVTNEYGEGAAGTDVQVTFEATILSGARKGETVTAVQYLEGVYSGAVPEVAQGKKVVLIEAEGAEDSEWQLIEYVKTDRLFIFAALFVLALLLFGRGKGFNTILSLGLTCAAIFAVFIPAILSGKNIYLTAIIICFYTIVMTYLIVNGGNKKTLAAVFGCFGGIVVSGLLTVVMSKILALTGYVDEDSVYLTYLSTANDVSIDLKAIIFAAVLIGAMGAIMDVAMSIASSLWEVREKSQAPTFSALFKSGMNIGRDVMGTMANTLILAYIGSSLSIVLLLTAYSTSPAYLLNREMIVVEILQALVGSFGILITMPLTSFISAAIYTVDTKKLSDELWESLDAVGKDE